MESCLDRLNRDVIAGDAATLCLGQQSTAGVSLPADGTTSMRISNAEIVLRTQIANRCGAGQLASLDVCGADPTSAGDCLTCTSWRRAVQVVQSAYGP
jgi:hypothetical protein